MTTTPPPFSCNKTTTHTPPEKFRFLPIKPSKEKEPELLNHLDLLANVAEQVRSMNDDKPYIEGPSFKTFKAAALYTLMPPRTEQYKHIGLVKEEDERWQPILSKNLKTHPFLTEHMPNDLLNRMWIKAYDKAYCTKATAEGKPPYSLLSFPKTMAMPGKGNIKAIYSISDKGKIRQLQVVHHKCRALNRRGCYGCINKKKCIAGEDSFVLQA